ncbi:glycoside hydrolase family 97 protein [Marinimicrobium agarilyticum]|uniref:glycoside hydrolase family 97 protein n=1 Tax=Marinimicrobium agarilyticum TaxID=306546 RepID=UPI0004827A1B|nr:glycoside hydrolase family 97 protein [Marinimicrobium agarilyticum]
MRRSTLSLTIGALCLVGCSTSEPPGDGSAILESPDGSVRVALELTPAGELQYQVFHEGVAVLEPSDLGISLEDAQFSEGLSWSSMSSPEKIEDHYQMLQGKQRDIYTAANEQTVRLTNPDGEEITLRLRAFDDGVAFRYEFPENDGALQRFESERTSFDFPKSAKAWMQRMQVVNTGWESTNPAYEEHYEMAIPVGTESPTEAGWVFPALFKNDANWVLLSEVGMQSNFHAARLQTQSPEGEYRVGVPMKGEVFTGGDRLANDTGAFHSPWRTITVGSLADITASTMGTDLAEPAVIENTDFVEPGVASWSWGLLKDESITYDIQKWYIDYAADMDWEYTLVDVNWDQNIGYERMQELVDYAASKDVGLILWYNSAGGWNTAPYTPRNKLLTRESRREEFARLQEMGVRGVKVDFFPGDGQSAIAYYRDVLQDAADFELMVNHHGSTLPRGIQRTFPNMMTMESVHGMEMVTFFQETADKEPSHAAMLPFARNVFDPMDYTPTAFNDLHNPEVTRKSRNGMQLAMPVVFVSGQTHIVETPDGMAKVPEYVRDFLRDLPVAWDESRLLSGYPGKHAVFARRSGDRWYIAGINGEYEPKVLQLDLSFIGEKKGTLITDGEEPRSFQRRAVEAGPLELTLQPAGGFVAVFE